MAYNLERKEDGNVYVEGSDVRVMLIPIEMLSSMSKEFQKLVGPAAKVLMREVGKSLGLAMADIIKRERDYQDGVASALEAFLTKCGFGEVKASECEGCYHVTFEDAPSLKRCETCDFEAGVIIGLLESLTGKKWRAQVTKKDNFCTVHAVPLE